MVFSLEYLQRQLALLPEAKRYLVGYSGGLDSQVLLTAMTQLVDLTAPIVAVHINHSINSDSDRWQEYCAEVADDLKINFLTKKIDANPPTGKSPEAWARKKRYAAFSSLMKEGDILLLAQHQNDQIETFFLQLLRGAGPHGLASMPMRANFSVGLLVRPLLEVKRQDLECYAQENQLQWIEDPSNQDYCYDRNYLRHEIMPLINKRWPGYTGSISRSVALQSDACVLLNSMASDDLDSVRCENSSSLSVQKLRELNDITIRNLLRYWVVNTGFTLPSSQQLRQLIDTVLNAADDRSPCVNWADVEVRRYRDQLMIMSHQVQQDPDISFQWSLKKPLKLSIGILSAKKIMGKGFLIDSDSVDIRFRQGGEELKIGGHSHTITLKKFFQEQGVPPWVRGRIPLIYSDQKLVAVSDLCIVNQFVVDNTTEGWVVSITQEKD